MQRIKLKIGILWVALFCGSTGIANAASGLVLEGGLHFGGDKLATVYTSSGTSDITAGGLFSFGIGVSLDLATDVESRITIGVKEDGVFGSNGNVTFKRYPIDVLVLKRTGGWKIGGGVTYHLNPEYNDSTYYGVTAPFDNAFGLLLELDRELGNVYIGGRLTMIDYQLTGYTEKFNGNSFGIVAGIKF